MHSDFRDLSFEFNAHEVECLLVGAHALAAHGHVRAANDLGVGVRPSAANAARILGAVRAFEAPLHDLETADLSEPGLIFQIGVPLLRIDTLTTIDGVSVRRRPRLRASRFDLIANKLIANKRATGRLQDLADIERLEQLGDGVGHWWPEYLPGGPRVLFPRACTAA
ncbi:MAG: hypothetical protein AB7I09_17370 [Planctomycetota bacterium]